MKLVTLNVTGDLATLAELCDRAGLAFDLWPPPFVDEATVQGVLDDVEPEALVELLEAPGRLVSVTAVCHTAKPRRAARPPVDAPPALEAPSLEAPASRQRGGLVPATDPTSMCGLEAPALEAPALQAPALEAPALQAPTLEAPALQSAHAGGLGTSTGAGPLGLAASAPSSPTTTARTSRRAAVGASSSRTTRRARRRKGRRRERALLQGAAPRLTAGAYFRGE